MKLKKTKNTWNIRIKFMKGIFKKIFKDRIWKESSKPCLNRSNRNKSKIRGIKRNWHNCKRI